MTEERGAGGGHDFVRPFIMTGGRTASAHLDLRFETLVRRVPGALVDGSMPSEKRDVLEQCPQPRSVAEIASALHLVVGVVTVLIEDLAASGHVEAFTTDPEDDDELDLDILNRITDKIRSL